MTKDKKSVDALASAMLVQAFTGGKDIEPTYN